MRLRGPSWSARVRVRSRHPAMTNPHLENAGKPTIDRRDPMDLRKRKRCVTAFRSPASDTRETITANLTHKIVDSSLSAQAALGARPSETAPPPAARVNVDPSARLSSTSALARRPAPASPPAGLPFLGTNMLLTFCLGRREPVCRRQIIDQPRSPLVTFGPCVRTTLPIKRDLVVSPSRRCRCRRCRPDPSTVMRHGTRRPPSGCTSRGAEAVPELVSASSFGTR